MVRCSSGIWFEEMFFTRLQAHIKVSLLIHLTISLTIFCESDLFTSIAPFYARYIYVFCCCMRNRNKTKWSSDGKDWRGKSSDTHSKKLTMEMDWTIRQSERWLTTKSGHLRKYGREAKHHGRWFWIGRGQQMDLESIRLNRGRSGSGKHTAQQR